MATDRVAAYDDSLLDEAAMDAAESERSAASKRVRELREAASSEIDFGNFTDAAMLNTEADRIEAESAANEPLTEPERAARGAAVVGDGRTSPDATDSSGSASRPQYVYAESREEAQRLLDASYLNKYRVVPVRRWRRWLRGSTEQPAATGLVLAHFDGGSLDGQTRKLDLASIFRSHGDCVYVRTADVVGGETWYRCLGENEIPPAGLPIRGVN